MRLVPLALVSVLVGCGGDEATHAPVLLHGYEAPGFFDSPFPDEARRGPGGLVDVSSLPNPTRSDFVDRLVAVANETPAFGTTSTIFFRASEPLAVELDYADSVADDAPVFLVNLADGRRHPISVRFREDGGPFGDADLLSLLPLQGVPLAADASYAAVVTDAVQTTDGRALTVHSSLASILSGTRPAGLSEAAFEAHRDAVARLGELGVAADRIVGLAAFRTADPTAGLAAARDLALALDPPAVTDLSLVETFDTFCVYQGTTRMPDYQRGELPYDDGGGWDLEAPPGDAEARVVITLPRTTILLGPVPTVLFSRTGGGGDRPLVDRGVRDESGMPVEPGSGPARELAAVGYAGVSIDGPHGGPRNPMGMDEQFLIFNVQNPLAMRDNIRQSALELIVAAQLLETLTIDATDCPDVGREIGFDLQALMGHSMGATISPLAFALEPRFSALVLSGAGGSWIENVVFKESPVPVRPFAELLLMVSGRHRLHEHDPALALLQWAGESADPPAHAGRLTGDTRHVLMLQGIVDTYILPPMANATSLSLSLDLAGERLDETDDRLSSYAPLAEQLVFSGRAVIPLPARANRGGATAVVVQHPEDPVEDGHEVVFQTELPKAQYRCFLATLLDGAPTVPAAGGACP